ncbi:MAG: OprO/OprP family phosphate-selective porin, partial [Thiovulaceae bacterium]|nr:OprO/OprP family phosphate-selective porin [Sulfurimonadaceae bacterium]
MISVTNALGAKKVVLSTLAVLALSATAYAETMSLYTDPATGQVFTQPGEGRQAMGDVVSAKEVSLENQEQDSVTAKEDSTKKYPTVENPDSIEFLLGKETAPNMQIHAFDNPDMWIKLGVRVQGTFENKKRDYVTNTIDTGPDTEMSDAYLRRTRFEVSAGFSENVSYVMDIRNDKANYEDKGEQTFNVGDAYLKIKKAFGTSLVNFKFYRGKIDISRTETVKSAYVLHYDRPHVADEAAQYITHNRRGTNAKMYGDWKKKIHYEVAVGDGVYSGKSVDAAGNKFSASNFSQESFFYGGKVVLSPFDGWEETSRTESYFAKGKHFEIGAAYWVSPDITYDIGTVAQKIDHKLINLEMSAHYKGAFVQAEYFKFDGVVKDWTTNETGKSNGW